MAIPPVQPSAIARGVYFLSDLGRTVTKPRTLAAITCLTLAHPVHRITNYMINHLRSLSLFRRDRQAHLSSRVHCASPETDLGTLAPLPHDAHSVISSYLSIRDIGRLQQLNRTAFSHTPFVTEPFLRRYEHHQIQTWCDEETAFKRKLFGPLKYITDNFTKDTPFAILCTTWTAYQAYQTFLQFAPEFAPAIHAFRSSPLVLAANALLLVAVMFDFWKHSPPTAFTIRLSASFGVLMSSAFVSFLIGLAIPPSYDLAKLHSQLQLPKSVDLRLGTIPLLIPTLFLAQSYFYLFRAKHSSNPRLHLLSSIFSFLNFFFGTIPLCFVHITLHSSATSPHSSQQFPFQLCSTFLLHLHCFRSKSHLLAALKPISIYALDFLGKTATYHWKIQTNNSTEIARKLTGISLSTPSPLQPCACNAMATLTYQSLTILTHSTSGLSRFLPRFLTFSSPTPPQP